MRIGSLCSGIGLLELGLEWAGLGETIWQVEVKPECRAVLKHWWPEATQYEDVRTVTNLPYVDLICFGSPCQNLSSAGDRTGLSGNKSRLFWDCMRVVGEVRPEWIVFENVASGASLWVDPVRNAMAEQGYETLPIPLAAADCGAPHRRARVFIVAHTDTHGEHAESEHAEVAKSQATDLNGFSSRRPKRSNGAQGWTSPEPAMGRVVHGRSNRVDGARKRISALGNAVVPQCAEVIGHVIRAML